MYGPYTNEELVGKAIRGRRDNVVLATKFGIVRDPNDPAKRGINGKPDYVRKSAKAAFAVSASRRSISITNTASIPRHRSKRRSARWRNW